VRTWEPRWGISVGRHHHLDQPVGSASWYIASSGKALSTHSFEWCYPFLTCRSVHHHFGDCGESETTSGETG